MTRRSAPGPSRGRVHTRRPRGVGAEGAGGAEDRGVHRVSSVIRRPTSEFYALVVRALSRDESIEVNAKVEPHA